MATYRHVLYNVLESYKKVHDDTTVQPAQVVFWIQVVTNRLRRENKEEIGLARYLTRFCSVPVYTDANCKNQKYIDIPTDVFDMDNDKGIQYITYNYDTGCCCTGPNFSQVQFQPTSPGESMRLQMDEYERPSPKQPYFYRVTGINNCDNVNRIYFLGLECIDVSDVEIGIVCSQDPSQVCNLDEEIPLPEWLIEELITRVLNLGRFILISPQERVNDGSDLTRRSVNQVPKTETPQPTEEQIVNQAATQQEQRQRIQNQLANGQ